MVAPRPSKDPLPCAQLANRSRDSLLATPRCPAVRRRPKLFSPFASGDAGWCRVRRRPLCVPHVISRRAMPHRALREHPFVVARLATIRLALLRRAPISQGVHASLPILQTVFAITRRQRLVAWPSAIAQPLFDPSPAATWGVTACNDAPCAPLVITPRSMPHRALRTGHAACDDAACIVGPRRRVQTCSRRTSQSQLRGSPPATPRCPVVRCRPTSFSTVASSVAGCCLLRRARLVLSFLLNQLSFCRSCLFSLAHHLAQA